MTDPIKHITPFTFKKPTNEEHKPHTLTTAIPYICRMCGRHTTYVSTRPGTKLCPCGNLVVEPSPDGNTLTFHYSAFIPPDNEEEL